MNAITELGEARVDYVRLDWSSDGETVTVTPHNEDRFAIKRRKLVDALKLAAKAEQIEGSAALLAEDRAMRRPTLRVGDHVVLEFGGALRIGSAGPDVIDDLAEPLLEAGTAVLATADVQGLLVLRLGMLREEVGQGHQVAVRIPTDSISAVALHRRFDSFINA